MEATRCSFLHSLAGATALAAALALVASSLLAPAEAGADSVLCQKKKGRLNVRDDACKRSEKQVDIRDVTGPPANVV